MKTSNKNNHFQNEVTLFDFISFALANGKKSIKILKKSMRIAVFRIIYPDQEPIGSVTEYNEITC